MTEIRLAPAAIRDMKAIWSYTLEAWSIDQADSYTATLHRDIARLRDFPELGTPYASRHGNFRKLPSAHHLIFYLVNERTVEIVRVLHKRMDVAGKLKD